MYNKFVVGTQSSDDLVKGMQLCRLDMTLSLFLARIGRAQAQIPAEDISLLSEALHVYRLSCFRVGSDSPKTYKFNVESPGTFYELIPSERFDFTTTTDIDTILEYATAMRYVLPRYFMVESRNDVDRSIRLLYMCTFDGFTADMDRLNLFGGICQEIPQTPFATNRHDDGTSSTYLFESDHLTNTSRLHLSGVHKARPHNMYYLYINDADKRLVKTLCQGAGLESKIMVPS